MTPWPKYQPPRRPPPPHALESLNNIDCYMDDVIFAVQGGPEQQHRVFYGTVCSLEWIFLSLTEDSKYLVSV